VEERRRRASFPVFFYWGSVPYTTSSKHLGFFSLIVGSLIFHHLLASGLPSFYIYPLCVYRSCLFLFAFPQLETRARSHTSLAFVLFSCRLLLLTLWWKKGRKLIFNLPAFAGWPGAYFCDEYDGQRDGKMGKGKEANLVCTCPAAAVGRLLVAVVVMYSYTIPRASGARIACNKDRCRHPILKSNRSCLLKSSLGI
jgi:hypothetical protein